MTASIRVCRQLAAGGSANVQQLQDALPELLARTVVDAVTRLMREKCVRKTGKGKAKVYVLTSAGRELALEEPGPVIRRARLKAAEGSPAPIVIGRVRSIFDLAGACS